MHAMTLELLPSPGRLAIEVDGRLMCYADPGQPRSVKRIGRDAEVPQLEFLVTN